MHVLVGMYQCDCVRMNQGANHPFFGCPRGRASAYIEVTPLQFSYQGLETGKQFFAHKIQILCQFKFLYNTGKFSMYTK